VSALALANSLNTNQVFKWRRQYLNQTSHQPIAKSNVLLPVMLTAREDARSPAPVSSSGAAPAGHIDITLAHGQIRVHGAVDGNALRTLVQSLRA
ncbi:MAG: hypothetical protein ABI040_00420, partial [Rhodoferax sp.]